MGLCNLWVIGDVVISNVPSTFIFANLDNSIPLTVPSRRTRFVIIRNYVHLRPFAAIGTVEPPVVNDVVAVVYGMLIAREAWISATMVREEIMVIRGIVAAPNTAVAVWALLVVRIPQAFTDKTPLNRDVLIAIEGEAFIDAPTDRTVVDNDVCAISAAQRVNRFTGFIAGTKSQVLVP